MYLMRLKSNLLTLSKFKKSIYRLECVFLKIFDYYYLAY